MYCINKSYLLGYVIKRTAIYTAESSAVGVGGFGIYKGIEYIEQNEADSKTKNN
jgi:hypothetical protein